MQRTDKRLFDDALSYTAKGRAVKAIERVQARSPKADRRKLYRQYIHRFSGVHGDRRLATTAPSWQQAA